MWKINASMFVLALQLAALSSSVQAAPQLKLSLSSPSGTTTTDIDGALDVVATITNTGDEDLELYPEPRGLLSTLPTNAFKVSKAGGDQHVAKFIGAVGKYSYKHATTVSLKVGESKSVTHHLSRAFEITEEGTWDIEPTFKTFYYKDATTGGPVALVANVEGPTVHAKISGSLKSRHVEHRKRYYERVHLKRSDYPLFDAISNKLKRRSPLEKRIEYANCNEQQQAEILEASYIASRYTADSEKFLTLNAASTERWTTWFGEFDSDNHNTVLTHFTNIRTSDLKTYTYDCTCDEENPESLYAYVFPDQFGHVYLCGQFMSAAVQGADSKAGTMVHEATHFTRNGGTSDIAYSRELAMELAQTNATEAIKNADSHEYFAENTPKLG